MLKLEGKLRDDVIQLSREIHSDPELAYEEFRAVERIRKLLEAYGHKVEVGFGGVSTAFRARFGPPGKAVAFLAEYDALAGVGHGCGHNLIALSNVGAFLLAASARDAALRCGIEVIGTPAEENGGGKIDLLNAGAFSDVSAALSSHPTASADWVVSATVLASVGKKVTYHGQSSHAGASPELGRNALNGVIRLFIGIDGWRQHLPADTRVHGIITDGGEAANVVPARAQAKFGIRAKELPLLEEMVETFTKIAEGAALQTGTTVEIDDYLRLYAPVKADWKLGDILTENLSTRGIEPKRGTLITGSTDLGNVSQVVPTDWIRFPVTEAPIAGHSPAMREASLTPYALTSGVLTAEALAACALAVATNSQA